MACGEEENGTMRQVIVSVVAENTVQWNFNDLKGVCGGGKRVFVNPCLPEGDKEESIIGGAYLKQNKTKYISVKQLGNAQY